MLYLTEYASPLGMLTLVSDENSLIGLWMEGQKYFKSTLRGKEQEIVLENLQTDRIGSSDILKKTVNWLERYFDGGRPETDELILAPQGSEFRQLVWKNLCEIPYGEVVTYGELAKKVAAQMGRKNMSAQAIGGAVGHNPISIIIPCHRVIGGDGSLTGYAGGVENKRKLLELEGVLKK